MDHPEKLKTMSTEDTRRKQKQEYQVLRNILLPFSNKAGDYKPKTFCM